MRTVVCKFGGSSLADAAQFCKVADILHADAARRFVVASAPGKRNREDTKVTDLLYRCCSLAQEGKDFRPTLEQIRTRFAGIMAELELAFPLDAELAVIEAHLQAEPSADYMASRGEYLNSKLLAAYLGIAFVDAADAIVFRENGTLDEEATDAGLRKALSKVNAAVVPGFYGAMPNGAIRTFSRGGSDVTGSLVARAIGADIYENWTDVSGMLAADPRIVEDPRTVDYITYRELRELSYMGASVLHEDAVFPVRRAGIPINIRNTNRPGDNGTMIVDCLPDKAYIRSITGVTGKKGFCCIQVEKSMMNAEVGFGARLLKILADFNVPFEHCPTGIDTMSVLVHRDEFCAQGETIISEIRAQLSPDVLELQDNLALIAVVGCGLASTRGTASRVFRTVADSGIDIRMIDMGSSSLNLIIAVAEKDFEETIRVIYREFR